MNLDENKNPFVKLGDMLITYIEKQKVDPNKDWARYDRIRIEAHKNDETTLFLLGTEIPVGDYHDIVEIIKALSQLYKYEKQKSKKTFTTINKNSLFK